MRLKYTVQLADAIITGTTGILRDNRVGLFVPTELSVMFYRVALFDLFTILLLILKNYYLYWLMSRILNDLSKNYR